MAYRTAEHHRLEEARSGEKKWRRWGTYLPERQWGTVREDYSPDGDAWSYFPFDHAAMRAYRWGEDGLLGLCDNRGLVCFCTALWNGADPILKERLFGLSGPEGNHGEDVKELYWYLDATPTCSYARGLYKYPHAAFPYEDLRARARQSNREQPEYEILDTGVFSDDRYFDVVVEYAKADVDDVLVRLTITNRGRGSSSIVVIPQLWFRNTWSWGSPVAGGSDSRLDSRARPQMFERKTAGEARMIETVQPHLGRYWFYVEGPDELLFTDNESNAERLWGARSRSAYVKDAFHDAIVRGLRGAINPAQRGTKLGASFSLHLGPGETRVIRARYAASQLERPFATHSAVFEMRAAEADEFFAAITPRVLEEDDRRIFRQSIAGLLWSRQYYAYEVERWLRGDPEQPPPPTERWARRNHEWRHLFNSEVLSMPDKWEYPWYAAWDLAFHCIPLALVDAELAKQQLTLLVREWYMHPSGQIPAYEWKLGDVNPPVHAWAAYRVYQIERRTTGRSDRGFLESIFLKLMLNFTWWVNRKDTAGRNVFEGGFLGLDNIGVFDRSQPLPGGRTLEQADATSWMGMYCLNMLDIALELARENPSYQDVANKFFEHFLLIAHAINHFAGEETRLWDEEDGFYYDVMRRSKGESFPVRVRSIVGLTPLFAVTTIEASTIERFGAFWRRARWLLENRPELADHCPLLETPGQSSRHLLSLVDRERLPRLLARMLSESEFLSPHGLRSLSRAHAEQPYELVLDGSVHRVGYEPAESHSGLFGGNSNWRGPVWMPVNYLVIEALQRLHHYYGDTLRVECPTGSGRAMTLWEVAGELSARLIALFQRGADGRRPVHGSRDLAQHDPHFKDYVTFYEYFNGDTGEGLGARAQTGWTALVAKLLEQSRLRR
ncbi:MAG TPA: glucosidase [Polyangiaceae bacterium]|nr:glucosidase [Polyangiaceae bacterium]